MMTLSGQNRSQKLQMQNWYQKYVEKMISLHQTRRVNTYTSCRRFDNRSEEV